MTLIRTAVLLGAAYFLTKQLTQRSRGSRMTQAMSGAAGSGTSMAGSDASTDAHDGSSAHMSGSESPNMAEILQGSGALHGTASGIPKDDDMFASTSQQDSQARAPGLPDQFRGA